MSGPFHAGELEAQARAGGGASGGAIRPFLSAQHRAFFEALPFVGVAGVVDGWPAATLLAGAPGFVSARDERTLAVAARVVPPDPLAAALVRGAPVGLLGIELATRRRNRANGILLQAGPDGFVVDVRQSFGNCPQYIHPRTLSAVLRTASPAEPLQGLDAAARATIARADTFFVASAARAGEASGGADLSHRGGSPGFVRVEGDTLTIPDYPGNRYFDTLGNMVSDPRAAVLFVDLAEGELLHLDGTVEIVWDGPEVHALPGAERLWRLRVRRGLRRRGAFPLRVREDPRPDP